MSLVHSHNETVPKAALMAACALVVTSLTAVSIARIAQVPPAASPVAARAAAHVAATASRDLRFEDRSDGSVRIVDVSNETTAGVVNPGATSGFIRGVMRGLARDRHKRGIGPEAPFRLTSWANGQLSLTDSVSGRTIELSGFGDTNRAAFAALLVGAR